MAVVFAEATVSGGKWALDPNFWNLEVVRASGGGKLKTAGRSKLAGPDSMHLNIPSWQAPLLLTGNGMTSAMTNIDVYFDFRSPYSYLAHSQLGTLDAELSYHPVDIVAVMKQVGNTPTTLTCPAKGKYAGADLQRWAKRYGMPLSRRKDVKSIDGRRLLRAVLAAEECGLVKEAVAAIFPAFWGHGLPLSTAEDLARILDAAGIRDPRIASRIDSSELDDRLTQRSEAAGARGVFGAPTFIVNDEMFFGNDRLEFIRETLRAA